MAQKWQGIIRKQDDILLKEHILAIHQTHKMYGYPRMKIALRDKGFHVKESLSVND
ncbi:IS3 family transposase [Niallia circulans]|uniref:IS3 family transposase n=1 Tax=Niallia circulans TaxID=1397 RepID=UPI003B9828DA